LGRRQGMKIIAIHIWQMITNFLHELDFGQIMLSAALE